MSYYVLFLTKFRRTWAKFRKIPTKYYDANMSSVSRAERERERERERESERKREKRDKAVCLQ